MSDYSYVADRAKKAFASISKLESLLQKEPDNRAALVNLSGMRRMAAEANAEMERLAQINQIDICRYRLVPMRGESYALKHVSKSLLEYQNLFSQIHDSFLNGPKSKAVFGADAEAASEMNFAYTYSGSLGVVLLAKNDRGFFSGSLDQSIDALYQVMEIDDTDTVRTIAESRGRAVVKRISDWSNAHADAGFSADVKWKQSDGRLKGQLIDHSQLVNIAEIIQSSADAKTDPITINGVLVGANLDTKSFHITVPDGETYKGHFAPEFVVPQEMTVGRFYTASLLVSDTYYYSTDQHVKKNTLNKLSGPLSPENLV